MAVCLLFRLAFLRLLTNLDVAVQLSVTVAYCAAANLRSACRLRGVRLLERCARTFHLREGLKLGHGWAGWGMGERLGC